MKTITLKNKNGIEATFIALGQRLVSLRVPDKKGIKKNIVLGYENLEDYKNAHPNYFGAIVGRYANRIAQGKFSIDNLYFELSKNEDINQLHGGEVGFHAKEWVIRQLTKSKVTFKGESNHLDEGFPGNLTLEVSYTLTEANELVIAYMAKTDRPTHVNLTHHSYFNLNGAGEKHLNGHIAQIHAKAYLPVHKNSIPTGELAPVHDTPFDFRKPKPIMQDIDAEHLQMVQSKGYDHCYVLDQKLNENELVKAAKIVHPKSGRWMEVYTDEPGMQFYTGNFLSEDNYGKNVSPFVDRSAFCLETQHFPDSPNNDNFPSTLLRPDELYQSTCVYKFGWTAD